MEIRGCAATVNDRLRQGFDGRSRKTSSFSAGGQQISRAGNMQSRELETHSSFSLWSTFDVPSSTLFEDSENPATTVLKWSKDWRQGEVNKEDLITKLHSISNETNRVPDSRHYLIRDGLLIDQDTGEHILDHITPGVEYEIAEELQRRVAEAEEGIFIWHSPKLSKVYPCNKTMIYQIVYNEKFEKVLLYSAILYDGDIPNPEEQRKTLISAADEDATFWEVLSWIESVSKQKPQVVKGVSRESAAYFAEQIRAGVDPRVVVEEMQASGFLGQKSISCSGVSSFSDYISARANILVFAGVKDQHGELTFKCSKGHTNVRPYGKLLRYCETCGEDVSCGNLDAVAA